MFKSVFTRLFFNNLVMVFTAMVVFMTAFMIFINDYITDSQFETDLKAARNIEFMTVSMQIENPNYRNYQIYNSMIRQYAESIDSEITVVDSSGNVYASTNRIKTVPEDFNKRLFSGEIFSTKSDFGSVYEKKVYVVGVPIKYRNGIVGGIYFNTRIPELRPRVSEYFVILLMAGLLSLIVGAVLTYILGRRITNPIKKLNKAVLEIASGDFSKRIDVTDGEIGQLASSFNHMASSLERLETMRAGFISDVSHELRTPMTSISGFVGGILDGTIPKEKENEYLQIVYNESVRLTKMTNDMLEMSKMQSSEYKLDISKFEINELIRTCIIQLGQKIENKNMEPQIFFNPEKINVIADKDAVKRVIINLLDNAVKFGFEETNIVIRTKMSNKKVYVSVGNYGWGIDKNEINSIFDRFYKTDKSRSEDKKGAGLGLSLAKNIVNLHNQKIWVECVDAEQGTGTKFTEFIFTLDLA